MTDGQLQGNEIDRLVNRVRLRMRAHAAAVAAASPAPEDIVPSAILPEGFESLPRPLPLETYLGFQDEMFLLVAYREILLRPPDPRGLQVHLAALRGGARDKIEILGDLRFSPEGMAAGVAVPGLARAYRLSRLFRLPVAGYLLRLANYFVRLPVLAANAQRLEAAVNFRFSELRNALATELRLSLGAKADKLSLDELQKLAARTAFWKADSRAVQELQAEIRALEARLARLEEKP